MVKPEKQELEALAMLSQNPQFQKVLGWLKRGLEDQDRRNRNTSEDYSLRQGQGRSQVLVEITDTAQEAPKKLDSIRRARPASTENTVY